VDKFLSKFNVDLGGFGPGLGMRSGSGLIMDAKASKLLDSDMSEEEFKDKWLEYAANKILGEYANVKISLKDGALNFDQTPAKERITLLGQDIEDRVSYADEESKKEFFKFLKDNDCWNNSRIIIVGDHGRDPIRTKDMKFIANFSGTGFLPDASIPLIMMKDFNSDGELKKDYAFMTLADIPALATKDLPLELQKNPFSGRSFLETQNKVVVKIVTGGNWHANHQLKFKQFDVGSWAFVKENVYNPCNWSETN